MSNADMDEHRACLTMSVFRFVHRCVESVLFAMRILGRVHARGESHLRERVFVMDEILNGRNPRGDKRLMDAIESFDEHKARQENGQAVSEGKGTRKTPVHNVEEVIIARRRTPHFQGKLPPKR